MASCPSAGEYSWVTKPVDPQGQTFHGALTTSFRIYRSGHESALSIA
jgi:hypothetical protein